MKISAAKTAVALAAALMTTPALAQNGSGLAVTVNGQPVEFSGQGPVENGGRVLVPLRGVLEKMGAYVTYDSAHQEVRAVRNEAHINLPIGSTTARVDGRPVTLDAPARILNGSTMVPLRFVAESLGARVNYEPATSTVAIRTESGGGDAMPTPPLRRDAGRNADPGADRGVVVRGTVLAVHPRDKNLVIQTQDGDHRTIALTPDYQARRRTPDGFATIDLDRLQPGDRVALSMNNGAARTVTLLPNPDALTR